MTVAVAALASLEDVRTALLRPLTDVETQYVPGLINQASALLRNLAPSIDTRIAAYNTDATDPAGIAPMVVASVVAGAVKRYLANPNGIVSQSVGPFSTAFALRGDKSVRGVLEITAEDLAVLFPNRKRPRVGSIRVRPSMAPRPVGRYGPRPGLPQSVEAVQDWHEVNAHDAGLVPPEWIAE